MQRIFTLANLISLLRIFLIIPLIILLEEYYVDRDKIIAIYSFLIILLIIVSDFFDGIIARKMNQTTNLGKALDPMADKVCMMAVLTFLTIHKGYMFLIFFIMISFRDIYIIIIVSYLINIQKEVFESNLSGKWFIGISSLMMTCYIYLDNQIINVTLYLLTILLMCVSTYEYSMRYFKVFLLSDKND